MEQRRKAVCAGLFSFVWSRHAGTCFEYMVGGERQYLTEKYCRGGN